MSSLNRNSLLVLRATSTGVVDVALSKRLLYGQWHHPIPQKGNGWGLLSLAKNVKTYQLLYGRAQVIQPRGQYVHSLSSAANKSYKIDSRGLEFEFYPKVTIEDITYNIYEMYHGNELLVYRKLIPGYKTPGISV